MRMRYVYYILRPSFEYKAALVQHKNECRHYVTVNVDQKSSL